jgi:hypothetical protein
MTYNSDDKQVEPGFHDSVSDCSPIVCPAGRYVSGGLAGLPDTATGLGSFTLASCTMCEAGSYSTGTGDETSCTSCPAGTYAAQVGNVGCKDCVKGKYSSSAGSPACADCAAGSYGTSVGADTADDCVECFAGTFSAAVGAASIDTCTACQPGKTGLTGAGASSPDVCVDCVAGKHALASGSTSCSDCPAGSYTSANGGAAKCSLCGYGKYSTDVAATSSESCLDCPSQHFNGFMGATECQFCDSPNVVTEDKGQCIEDTNFDEEDIAPGPYDEPEGGEDPDAPVELRCPLHSSKKQIQGEEACVCLEGFVSHASSTTGNVIACTCPEDQEIDKNAGETCVPKPDTATGDHVAHECAKGCDDNFFKFCDLSFFADECSEDCDAELMYVNPPPYGRFLRSAHPFPLA